MKVINPVATNTYATFTRASKGWYWDYNTPSVLQEALTNVQRFNWNPETHEFQGALIEPAAENLILNNATTTTQTRTVANAQYTLSFYGDGYIKLTGAVVETFVYGYAAVGKRKTYTFTPSAGSLTLTVTGSVEYAQLELGSLATSPIVTEGAQVTRAADIVTGTGLFYSTFTDTNTLWLVGSTYALGATVKHSYRLYRSLQAANVGHTPSDTASATWWDDIGPDNIFAAFDRQVSTPSVGHLTQHILCVQYPSFIDSVAVLGLSTDTVQTVISNGINNFAITTKGGTPTSAVTYGTTSGAILTVVVTGAGGAFPSIGEIVAGVTTDIGDTQYGFQVSMVDYSRKTTDDFGVTTFVPRNFAKRCTASIMVAKADYNAVVDFLFSIRASPTVFIAADDSDYSSGAIVYGFPESFDIEIAYPTYSICALQVQGLI